MVKKKIVILPVGVHRVKAKGRFYYYHRATKTRLKERFGTADFLLELKQVEDEYTQLIKDTRERFGTWGHLTKKYRASLAYTSLAPRTRKDYDKHMENLDYLSDMAIQIMDVEFLEELRDENHRDHKYHFANYMLSVISVIFTFAKRKKWLGKNPIEDVERIPKPKQAPIVNRAWSSEEYTLIEKRAPQKSLLLPIMIARYTGLRKGDILAATGANLKDGILAIRTSKTGALIKAVLPQKLLAAIKELSDNDLGYICTNTYGHPWTSDGFNASFFKFKKGLQDKGLIGENITFHGLRHTFATHLREENVTNEDIATALGHADPKTTNLYNKNVDTLKIQNKIVSIFDREENEK